MTNAEVFKLTIARCDKILEEQLAATEILLADLGASAEEIEAALDQTRRTLQADRDAQIAAVARWLTVGDDRLH
jgi:hypothetical protein